jgi:hypothetical protein
MIHRREVEGIAVDNGIWNDEELTYQMKDKRKRQNLDKNRKPTKGKERSDTYDQDFYRQ